MREGERIPREKNCACLPEECANRADGWEAWPTFSLPEGEEELTEMCHLYNVYQQQQQQQPAKSRGVEAEDGESLFLC